MSVVLLVLALLLFALAVVLYRLPLESWFIASGNSTLKQLARVITVAIVALLAASSLYGAFVR
jgi:hypothetical protein